MATLEPQKCEMAIEVESVSFSYNPSSPETASKHILSNVSLHVPENIVYALLGSNGSGKSTFLNILLSRLRPQSGLVRLFSRVTNSSGSKRRVHHLIGYMPQEIALYPNLTIYDTFAYFARVNHVDDLRASIRYQVSSYRRILGLKASEISDRTVAELSGGQKRYLSLCVTLLGQPKILLLDEPTVGIDSVIRQKIWDHINVLCKTNQTTVVLTTHYIDEARQASLIGFLRQGHILAEAPPTKLLTHFSCNRLEDVFYRLCTLPNRNCTSELFSFPPKYDERNEQVISLDTFTLQHTTFDDEKRCSSFWFDWDHMGSLARREWTLMCKGVGLLALFYGIPLLTLYLFNFTYGRTPHHLPVAIYNVDNGVDVSRFEMLADRVPNGTSLAQIYLELFDTERVRLWHYNSEDAAMASVAAGHTVMALSMRESFTESFIERYLRFNRLDYTFVDNLIEQSAIHVCTDNSRLLGVRFLNHSMLLSMQELFHRFGNMAGLNPLVFSMPVKVEEPAYGSLEPNFQSLFVVGMLLFVLVALNTLIGAMRMLAIVENGRLERDLNQGVRTLEVLSISHLMQLINTFFQVLVVFTVCTHVFGTKLDGNWFEALALVYLTTIQGIFIGTNISIFFNSQISVLLITFTVMAYTFFTSGTLWPIEGMPKIVQRVFVINPITLPIQSLRNIMLRGWPAMNTSVVGAYLITGITSIVFAIISQVLFYVSTKTKLTTFDFL